MVVVTCVRLIPSRWDFKFKSHIMGSTILKHCHIQGLTLLTAIVDVAYILSLSIDKYFTSISV